MNRLTGLILKIIIYIIKNINKNAGMLIDILENMYALTVNVKTKTLEKMIKVLLLIVGCKIMEIVVDNKIVTAVEIIKIINNYITIKDVLVVLELWVTWILYILKINTNIIILNSAVVILIIGTVFTKYIYSGISNTISMLGILLLDTRIQIRYAHKKGIRSCIPFV